MKRVQMRRGVKLPPGTKYVGRPSRWGNPWKVGERMDAHRPLGRESVVNLYRSWLIGEVDDRPDLLDPLRGHDLACYCSLDQPCHADVLLELLG